VLSSDWVKNAQIPCVCQKEPTPILDGSGNHIPGSGLHYTTTVDMYIGDYKNKMRFEVADMPAGKENGYLPITWLKDHNPDNNWQKGSLKWRSEYCKAHSLRKERRLEFITEEELLAEDPDNIFVIGIALYTDEDGEDIKIKILPQYRDYADIFSQEKINALPKHRKYDHRIDLIPEGQLPQGPIYPLSKKELDALWDYIREMEDHGKIRRSSSTIGAAILFVPKPDATLRLCVDYQGLNKITIKNKYPLPLMSELRSRLGKAIIFTKLDLKNSYCLIGMAEGEERKTAFKSRYGLYEYTVMPFGLCNAPSTFQSMINDVCRDMLDIGVIAYMDNILIYMETVEEHVALVRWVMERLPKAPLCLSIKKSSFHQREVEFLGYKISDREISRTSTKVEEIRAWSTPENVVDVQSFIGFANFYCRFINGLSKIAKPSTDLIKKGIKGTGTPSCLDAFDKLKEMFTTGSILTHFDDTRPTKLETDASDFALGAVLSQLCEDQRWHPLAFHSRKFSPAEMNYDVHDNEMATRVAAFKEWAYMLMSVDDQILVYTDHKNLEYFITPKTLYHRQHRWAEFLQRFNFKVIYREGWLNEMADALSKCRDYRPEGGSTSEPFTFFRPGQYIGEEPVMLRPHVLQTCQGFRLQTTFHEALMKTADIDETYLATLKALLKGDSKVDTNFCIEKDLLLYKNRWYITKDESLRRTIMEAEHDSKIAGHFGTYKTIGMVRANLYWPKMDENITEYVRSCDVCQRNNVVRHKKFGLLEPLEVPMRPLTAISMDFIVGLPKSNGYTKIWVIIDRFSKMAHFISLRTEEHIKELALTFVK